MLGRIFSIEEFSTFDGPGIRCTVFLKGCPLRCQWCHNPEGQSFEKQVIRSPNGCIHCGNCERTNFKNESINACPQHLIRMCGEDLTAEDLINRIKDKFWMLNASGGGITFSGGEPISQPDFLLNCFSLLKGSVHRAVQTSGFAHTDIFRKVLDNSDYVLFDLKHMDSNIHRHYTGVDNDLILINYRLLAESGVEFITRIPLIPGVNDTSDNLTQTAVFLSGLGINKIELLPYNRGAGAKYKSLGRNYVIDFDGDLPPNLHKEIFGQYHIEVNIL